PARRPEPRPRWGLPGDRGLAHRLGALRGRRTVGVVRRGARPGRPGRVPPRDVVLLPARLTCGPPADILSPVSRDPLNRAQVFEARVERWRPDLMTALGRVYDDPDAVAERALAVDMSACAP